MQHAEPAPTTPLQRWLLRLVYGLAAVLGMVYSYDFGKVIGGTAGRRACWRSTARCSARSSPARWPRSCASGGPKRIARPIARPVGRFRFDPVRSFRWRVARHRDGFHA